MDATFTVKEVIALLLAIGGMIGTFWTLMWQMRVKISDTKEHLDEKRHVEVSAIYDRINSDKKELSERMDRNAATCRENERELFKELTEIKAKMVSEKNLQDMEHRLEAHVNQSVRTAISELKAELPELIAKVFAAYKTSP